jgi:hypothetical protein
MGCRDERRARLSAVERRILTGTPDLRHYGGEQISVK